MGIAFVLVFADIGFAYGRTKSEVGICSIGVLKLELIIKSVIPLLMGDILGISSLIEDKNFKWKNW